MSEKSIEDVVQEALAAETESSGSRDQFTYVKNIAESINADKLSTGETDEKNNRKSILTTIQDLMQQNIESDNPTPLPTLIVDDDNLVSLVQAEKPIDLTPVKTETIEKTIVQREITVSSDQVDKQTVNEIDFDKGDFAATRTGDVLTVSLKGSLDSIAYVSSTDPSLTNTVSVGQFWFWTLNGKLYIRYGSFWVQPHPS